MSDTAVLAARDDAAPANGAAKGSPVDRNPGFRKDINGLRAIAVLSVVLYHFHTPYAWGGFVGVDVFFVISGFLMTRIITTRQAQGGFSLRDFYLDRVRRIMPALLTLCLILMVFSACFLDPIAVQRAAQSVATTILFVSNFDYAAQGGYFGAAPEANWLLHTWSLSVEWQFYLCYPFLLLLIDRIGLFKAHRITVLAVVGTASLVLCLAVLFLHSDVLLRFSFFMLPTRAWELIAGGMVSLLPRVALDRRIGVALAIVGLAMILASVLFFDSGTLWPGGWTALPVLGAAIVIAAGDSNAAWARLPGVQTLGLWSYSIYLWHWPAVAAFAYFGVQSGLIGLAAGLVLSLVLGGLSYTFAEQRLSRLIFSRQGRGGPVALICAVGLGLAVTGGLYFSKGLFDLKFPSGGAARAQAKLIHAAENDWTFPKSCAAYRVTRTGLRLCRQGGGGPAQTLVIGDSYSEEIAPRYGMLPRGLNDPAVLIASRPGCAPLPGVQLRGSVKNCAGSTREALALAKAAPYRKVVIIASWLGAFNRAQGEPVRGRVCFQHGLMCTTPRSDAAYAAEARQAFAKLSSVLGRLQARGVQVAATQVFPQSPGADPLRLYASLYRGGFSDFGVEKTAMEAEADYSNRLIGSLAGKNGPTLIDPIAHLCTPLCPIVKAGAPQYYDISHYRTAVVTSEAFAFLDPYILPQQPTPSNRTSQ